MTKHEAIEFISKKTDLPKKDVEQVVNLFIERMKYSLIKGQTVHLRKFGNFKLINRKPKKARDIGRNKTILVEGHKRPVFKPSKNLIELVNGKKIDVKR